MVLERVGALDFLLQPKKIDIKYKVTTQVLN